jgi:hypothetical protein
MANFSTHNWSAEGGIEIVGSTDGASVSVRAKSDVTRGGHFAKFAKGRLHFGAMAIIPPGSTQLCNPYYSYYIDVYKIFDVNHQPIVNKIVGPECITVGDTVTYSVDPWVSTGNADIGMDKYNWILPATLASSILYYSADSSSITFKVGRATTLTDSIKVEVGRCNFGVAHNYIVLPLRNSIPKPIITPSTCLPGGTTPVTFSVQNYVDGVKYTWSCDENWTIPGSNIGQSVSITPDRNNPARIYVDATYSGGGCIPVSSNTKVSRKLDPTFSTIGTTMSNNCFPVDGADRVITLNNAPSPATFVWDVPAGWNIISGEKTKEIKLRATATASLNSSISVAVDGCNTNLTASEIVSANIYVKPGSANPITGDHFCVDKNTSYTFSTTATSPAANSYYWTMPGWNITAGQGTTTVTATPTGDISSISVTPKGISGCDGVSSSKTVSYPPTAPTSITINKTCINSGLADQIVLTAVGGTTGQSYDWTVPAALGTISGNATGSSITVNTLGKDNSYTVSVRAYTNNAICQYSNATSTTVKISGLQFTLNEPDLDTETGSYYYTISPTTGWLTYSSNFNWNLDGTVIGSGLGAVASSSYSDLYTAASTHNFTVTITRSGCSTKRKLGSSTGDLTLRSAVITDNAETANTTSNTLTIENNSTKNKIVIYPNPASNTLTISLPEKGSVNIEIRDLKGVLLKTENNLSEKASIDISSIPAGAYVLSAVQNDNSYNKVFIIKK